MTEAIAWLKVDEDRLGDKLQELCALSESPRALTLDFSAVRRVDPRALTMLSTLADRAEERGTAVELVGVHVEIYRVLKLMKLASRFSFLPAP